MKRARILLADDHTLTLEGIRAILEPHHEIVGMVMDGRALLDAALRVKPDLIVLDITMPLLNGIDAAPHIKKSLPGVKLLFVTMHVNPAYLEAALTAGATGYVLKSAAREELLEAINSVLNGRIYVTPSLSSEHLERFTDPSRAAATLRLTTREREILQLTAEGRAGQRNCLPSEYLHQDRCVSSREHQEKAWVRHNRRIDQARNRTRINLASEALPDRQH
jgi:DNA-binding NarL/FixJ family response regulator